MGQHVFGAASSRWGRYRSHRSRGTLCRDGGGGLWTKCVTSMAVRGLLKTSP